MKAMILAAGLGTRLYPLTEDRTKPAIPFLNRPLITYVVDYLAGLGIRDLIINLHHQPESVRQPLGDGSLFGVRIQYSFEEEILGPAGAFDRVRDDLMDDDFIVINGKIVTDIDLHAAVKEHRERGAIASLVLKENVKRERFSIVEVDEQGRIARFAGFPPPIPSETVPLMFVGIHVLSPRIFQYVPRNCYSDSIKDVYPQAMRAGETVIGHVTRGNWYEMSTLGRYLESSLLFAARDHRSVITGTACTIADGAMVADSVLWNGVTVESGARVRRAVLGERVRIPAGAVIENAAVVRADIVSKIERGDIAGENLIVPIEST